MRLTLDLVTSAYPGMKTSCAGRSCLYHVSVIPQISASFSRITVHSSSNVLFAERGLHRNTMGYCGILCFLVGTVRILIRFLAFDSRGLDKGVFSQPGWWSWGWYCDNVFVYAYQLDIHHGYGVRVFECRVALYCPIQEVKELPLHSMIIRWQ